MDLYGPKEFDDPQVFDDPKGISIGSMNFDNPKVYGDTSIFNGLVSWKKWLVGFVKHVNTCTYYRCKKIKGGAGT